MQTGDDDLSVLAHGIPEPIRKLFQVDTSGISNKGCMSQRISLDSRYGLVNALDELAPKTRALRLVPLEDPVDIRVSGRAEPNAHRGFGAQRMRAFISDQGRLDFSSFSISESL
jgi:hypothetical protein